MWEVVDVVEERKEKEKETRPGVPAWFQVAARVCSLVAPEMSLIIFGVLT